MNKDTKLSEHERLELCKKLDKELDEFIEKLPRREQVDSEPPEGWLEDLEKHPFFMKKEPEPGEELHPLYQGLQQLKYDPNENTPNELATSYKEDGNFNFKHKNYRLAVLSYSEGLKVKSGNPEIEASLYNNRSAAHWFLKNYRSCLKDCEAALKLKPNYTKSLMRAANAAYALSLYEKACEFCDNMLESDSSNSEALALRQKSLNAAKSKERDLRKREADARKKAKVEESLLEEIKKRGICIDGSTATLQLEMLEPQFPQLVNQRVSLSSSGELCWPLVLLYPEYQLMDFLQECNENETALEQLRKVFATPAEWDRSGTYNPDSLNVYFEDKRTTKLFKVDLQDNLRSIMKHERFVLYGGTPSFIVLVKDSKHEISFLEKY